MKSPTATGTSGRPSRYTQEMAAHICERVIAGESIRAMCRDEDMPAASRIFDWLQRNEEFREQYAHAREVQAEMLADEIIEIADDATDDYVKRVRKDGPIEIVCDHENINRSRLRVEARKWAAAKLLPKKYGGEIGQNRTP